MVALPQLLALLLELNDLWSSFKCLKKAGEGYYFGAMDENAISQVFNAGMKKRKSDKVTIGYKARNLKAHLKAADKAGAQILCYTR